MILVDTVSLFNSCKQRYKGSLDYTALFHHIESIHQRQPKIVYAAEHEGSERFLALFDKITNCQLKTKKPRKVHEHLETDFAVEITTDCLTLDYPLLILCTTDVRFLPLLQFLDTVDTEDFTDVYVYGVGVPRVFEPYCIINELPEKFIRVTA